MARGYSKVSVIRTGVTNMSEGWVPRTEHSHSAAESEARPGHAAGGRQLPPSQADPSLPPESWESGWRRTEGRCHPGQRPDR